MSDAVIRHAFVSAKPDGPDTSRIRASNWNANLLFSAGAAGEVLVPAAGSATGAAWTGTPTVTGITATGIVAFTTPAESWIGPSTTTGLTFKNGRVGIGTADPAKGLLHLNDGPDKPATSLLPGGTVLCLNGAVGGSGTLLGVTANSDWQHLPGLYLRSVRARGTLVTPTTVAVDDMLTFWEGEAFSTSRQPSANIGMFVENVSGAAVSGYINFMTSPIGASGNPAERMRITSTGVRIPGLAAFAASDKYLVIDASGNLHVSALGPAS